MSRFLLRLALGAGMCVLFVGVTPAADQDSEQEIAPRPLPRPEQAKILAALDQPTEFDFQKIPLGDVIDYFRQKHELQILLDTRALSNEEIGTDAPVTQTLKDIRLRSALRLLLEQLKLTYVVRDGYLLITTMTEAEDKLSLKVYPVQDLVALDSEFRPSPFARDGADDSPSLSDIFPRLTIRGAGGGGLNRLDDEGDFSGLIELITTTVAPITWDEVGGPGSITANPQAQSIAVSQTDEVHEGVVALLAALRRARNEQMAAAKRVEPPLPPDASDASEQNMRLYVRAFRLMRGTGSLTSSVLAPRIWHPPVEVRKDSTPPRRAVADGKTPESSQSSAVRGDAAKDSPAAKEAESSKEAEPPKKAELAKEAEPAAGADKEPAAHPTDRILEAMTEKIAKLIPEIIEPQSWEPQGKGFIRAVGEGIVVRQTEEVQHRVARLVAELLPDCVPMAFDGPWGPWRAPLEPDRPAVWLRPATDNWPCQAEPRPTGKEAEIDKALREKCDLEFTVFRLIDALSWLAAQTGVQFCIDHRALADQGIRADALVTCSAEGLRFKTALSLLLDELDLTYSIRHEVLFITTKVAAPKILSIKVYPVFDLVAPPPNSPANLPRLDFTTLIDNITTSIAPTAWDDVGGAGSIREFTNAGALVIAQTTTIHEEIAEYLKAHREIRKAQMQVDENEATGTPGP